MRQALGRPDCFVEVASCRSRPVQWIGQCLDAAPTQLVMLVTGCVGTGGTSGLCRAAARYPGTWMWSVYRLLGQRRCGGPAPVEAAYSRSLNVESPRPRSARRSNGVPTLGPPGWARPAHPPERTHGSSAERTVRLRENPALPETAAPQEASNHSNYALPPRCRGHIDLAIDALRSHSLSCSQGPHSPGDRPTITSVNCPVDRVGVDALETNTDR